MVISGERIINLSSSIDRRWTVQKRMDYSGDICVDCRDLSGLIVHYPSLRVTPLAFAGHDYLVPLTINDISEVAGIVIQMGTASCKRWGDSILELALGRSWLHVP